MKLKNWIRAKVMIHKLAKQDGVSPASVRASMQEAIDAAWATKDLAAKVAQHRWFPAGKPTVEAFLMSLAQDLQTESQN